MARNLLIFAVLVSVAFQESCGRLLESEDWTSWKAKNGREYSTRKEELVRLKAWIKNKQLVKENNKAYDDGKRSFKMALNGFADQDLETVRKNLNVKGRFFSTERIDVTSSVTTSDVPTSWDWRKLGKVISVKNQGQIGSSIPMNVADALSSFSAIHDGTLLYDLSDQEVVDCCLPDPIADPTVYDCLHDHGGLCFNLTYHSGSPPNVCNNASCKAAATCGVGNNVTQGNESALAEAVYFTPVVVAIDASQMSFQLYESGVYADPNCSSTQLDHTLLLVGFGVTSDGTEYWICRNSWGSSWGEKGYINIAKNQNNMCGIATSAFYPANK